MFHITVERMDKIKFGTSGWRAKMSGEFNEINVLRVATGIAKYLRSKYTPGQVIVGWDARKDSEKFAKLTAGIIASHGFDVLLANAPTPTPATEYAVQKRRAIGGAQITASHNPAIYNGIKFIPNFGGQATNEITNQIEANIPDQEVKAVSYAEKRFIPKADFITDIKRKLDLSKVNSLKIVVDPLYGAGVGYLSEILSQSGAKVQEIHNYHDPNFGGMNPEPTEDALKELADAVVKSKADLGVANDGDADRIAVIDKFGNYYSTNQLSLVITDYLFKFKGMKGGIAKTVSTTSALDNLAKKYGVETFETPVGFKNFMDVFVKGKAIIGIEESGGIGFSNWVFDKDGIMTGAMICEIVANLSIPLDQLWKNAAEEYKYGVYLTTNYKKDPKLEAALDSIAFDKSRTEIAGRKIVKRGLIDGAKLFLDDGSTLLMRKSGTEPVLRVYIEAKDNKALEEINAVIEEIVKSS